VEILKRFEMLDCKAMATPVVSNMKLLQDTNLEIVDVTFYRKMVGSLMYFMNMRPYICFSVNTLSQYMEHPRKVYLVTTKHVIRYLKGKLDYCLRYVTDHEFGLYGYSYSDWAGNILGRKSTLTYFFSLGSSMVSWRSRKKSCVALSTTDVEYMVACATCREAVWIHKMLSGLFGLKLEGTCILCDNKSCMKLLENMAFHDRSKHIEIKYHYCCRKISPRTGRLPQRARLLTLRQKVLNVDTDFLSNLYKLMHEEEGEQKYLFIDVCPCTLGVELQSLALR
jgi:hypothetical protein